ncbi:MAG: hypothetical protein JNJ45_05490 [Chthonomonas sp.]|nr:hypothetical protein [Chthonomonas sp.]
MTVTLNIPVAHLHVLYQSVVENIAEVDRELVTLTAERSQLGELLQSIAEGMGGVPGELTSALEVQAAEKLSPATSGIMATEFIPGDNVAVTKPVPKCKLLEVSQPSSDEQTIGDWSPTKVQAVSAPKAGPQVSGDAYDSHASRLASRLQLEWEGFLASSPRVPRPKVVKWQASYTPEDYVEGLVGLAMIGMTTKIPGSSIKHIRESDGELIGYIRLLNDHAGEAQRERFCAQLLEQQKARIGA